jgi:glycosyltransferase involved in cell wall biosynthesis
MLGWEFPPFFAGGAGIACYELTKSLLSTQDDLEVTYVMPYGEHREENKKGVRLLFANHVSSNVVSSDERFNLKSSQSLLYAYDSPMEYKTRFSTLLEKYGKHVEGGPNKNIKELYGANIIEEVYLYAKRVAHLCMNEDFDVIHAHDWTTIPAALLLRDLTGKPVVLHVHITELNKTGGAGGHPAVLEIEKFGFQKADHLIAVSNQIKNMLIEKYQVSPSNVSVVYNGGVSDLNKSSYKIEKKKPMVLYAGRITLQKGPEYFVQAAKIVLEHEPEIEFVMAGTGDQLPQIQQLVQDLGIADSFKFPGFYTREDAQRLFSEADLFILPSVLEPFGITPLEAMAKGTPTIVSKQSGISEILEHAFKVDFWDTEEMANKILGLFKYLPLKEEISQRAYEEYDTFSWDSRALEIREIYNMLSLR